MKPDHFSSAINVRCCWFACSGRGREEWSGEPELVPVPNVDSEVHRVRLAVPGAAVESERRVVPQVERGLVGWCEPLDARARGAALFELVAAAEFLRLVVPGYPVARSAPPRGLRLRVVQARVVLRHVAALREYAPQDWAAR